MDTWVWVVIAVAAVLIIALIAWAVVRNRRTGRLRDEFGNEYDRTIDEAGSRQKAESELIERKERREELDIRPLTSAARERYSASWEQTQARFVDAPSNAIREADALVTDVMRERGYPIEDFDQRTADISVDHPHLVENYRAAHGISLANDQGQAETEDLRQAMIHYRALFEELLAEGDDGERPGERPDRIDVPEIERRT